MEVVARARLSRQRQRNHDVAARRRARRCAAALPERRRHIGAVSLEPFLGPCRVIHAIDCGPLITPEHLLHAADNLPPRILVRTAKHAAQEWWTDDFSAYAPQTIEWLAERGVMLIGLDTPSIDPASSKTLDSHHAILRHDMRVLENLVLDDVPQGDYELIALPLALIQADASPVRAVLRELG